MFKRIKEWIKSPTALEAFLATREIKTHADAEYWAKYFQYKGL